MANISPSLTHKMAAKASWCRNYVSHPMYNKHIHCIHCISMQIGWMRCTTTCFSGCACRSSESTAGCSGLARSSATPPTSRSLACRPGAISRWSRESTSRPCPTPSPGNTHTHTHTHLTALCPGLPRWAGTRKVKPIWILLKQETVSGSGIGCAICKSAPRSSQITTPAPHHSAFYRPDALPAAQPTASKHWRHTFPR